MTQFGLLCTTELYHVVLPTTSPSQQVLRLLSHSFSCTFASFVFRLDNRVFFVSNVARLVTQCQK